MKKLFLFMLLIGISLTGFTQNRFDKEFKKAHNEFNKRITQKFVITSEISDYKVIKPITEQQAVQKSHIDFTKEYLYFTISGKIEIDGHTFLNDTCKQPVIYQANLDCVKIIKGEKEYEHRVCDIKNCEIIHLSKKSLPFNIVPSNGSIITPGSSLLNLNNSSKIYY